MASQINLEELNPSLFLLRWQKDPSEQALMKVYQTFYHLTEVDSNFRSENILIENNDDDYKYLLNRIWHKVRLIVKAKAETAKTFYICLNELVEKEISIQVSEKTVIQNEEQIKNLTSIRPKGNIIKKIF